MYGTQTIVIPIIWAILFENDVEMYGTQTLFIRLIIALRFENDVEMYGTQTVTSLLPKSRIGLRMM